MFQALFWKKSCFAHFGQKLSKIGHFGPKCPKMDVFHTFLGIPWLLFSETLQLIRAFNSEKNVPIAFLKKIPFCPFWPKIVQNWPFGWMCATVSLKCLLHEKWLFDFFSEIESPRAKNLKEKNRTSKKWGVPDL